jgi:hypothetical protein
MPRLVSSTASDTNHGLHDLIPNFLIKSTYTSGLNMWTTSPNKNKRPETPLADQMLAKLGFGFSTNHTARQRKNISFHRKETVVSKAPNRKITKYYRWTPDITRWLRSRLEPPHPHGIRRHLCVLAKPVQSRNGSSLKTLRYKSIFPIQTIQCNFMTILGTTIHRIGSWDSITTDSKIFFKNAHLFFICHLSSL